MKRFFIYILAVLYLTASSSSIVYIHYCMNKQVGWGFVTYNADKCSNCGMEKNKTAKHGCCKDDVKQVKHHSDQILTETAFQLSPSYTLDLPVSLSLEFTIPFSSLTKSQPQSHAPPRSCLSPIYLINRTFRI